MSFNCENTLKVIGKQKEVEKFLDFAKGECDFDFNRFLPLPEDYKRLGEEARRKWRLENWWTTSNAYDVTINVLDGGEATIRFITACPPTPVIRKAGQMFPSIDLELRSVDGGDPYDYQVSTLKMSEGLNMVYNCEVHNYWMLCAYVPQEGIRYSDGVYDLTDEVAKTLVEERRVRCHRCVLKEPDQGKYFDLSPKAVGVPLQCGNCSRIIE